MSNTQESTKVSSCKLDDNRSIKLYKQSNGAVVIMMSRLTTESEPSVKHEYLEGIKTSTIAVTPEALHTAYIMSKYYDIDDSVLKMSLYEMILEGHTVFNKTGDGNVFEFSEFLLVFSEDLHNYSLMMKSSNTIVLAENAVAERLDMILTSLSGHSLFYVLNQQYDNQR